MALTMMSPLLASVPQPLTVALCNLAPVLALAARLARLAAWEDSWHASCLCLAAWWLLCLAGPVLFRYALPLVVALALFLAIPDPSLPVTEAVLQSSLADLTALPVLPRFNRLPARVLIRAAAILSVPWLSLSLLVSPRLIVALLGSVLLIYRAPWARVLSSVLWRSALFRHLCYRLRALLTGQPPPKYAVSHPAALSSSPQPASSLRFLFTVYENQRWWMGLDWTAALLPGERPSWCSPALHPVSPPNAFTLPDPTTIYLPSKDGKSRIKRTAVWKWLEPEWTLLVRKEGSSLSRIPRTPPPIDEPAPLHSSSSGGTGTRLLKAAASKFKDSPSSDPEDDATEPLTDPDGWIYGDNKWEGQSHRGGLGKFTRYRRWSRIALVAELVEVIEPGQFGVQVPSNSSIPAPQSDSLPPSPISQSPEPSYSPPTPSSSTSAILTTDPESPLRQRLRAALSKPSM